MITQFREEDLSQAIELTFDHWKDSYVGHSDEFIWTACELIVRQNFYNNKVSFKITADARMKGFLFGCHKDETNDALKWVNAQIGTLSSNQAEIFNNTVDYLNKFDALLSSHMTQSDMKVALFVSGKKGCGRMLLDHYMQVCNNDSIERLFLWTDSTCNYQYYPKNGFEELLRVDMANQNRKEKDFQTILYKKPVS